MWCLPDRNASKPWANDQCSAGRQIQGQRKEPIHAIADAVRVAARELDIPLRWGGAWDINFTASTEPTEDLVALYGARRRAAGLRVFIDGPHFELPKAVYP